MLTAFVLLHTLGPALLGLPLALLAWLVARARYRQSPVDSLVRGWTLAGVLMAVALVIADVLLFLPGGPLSRMSLDTRFLTPLIAGLVIVIALQLPVMRPSVSGSAELSRRTLTSFGQRWWFVALGVLVVVVLAVTIAAGIASSPDDQGRYTTYWVDFGAAAAGTGIYGWHYSGPAMVIHGLLLLAAVLAVRSIAKPPPAVEHAADAATRRWRTRNVLAVTIAALLLHLGAVLLFLSGTATVSSGFATEQGWFSSGAPFAALEMPLRVAGRAAQISGWFIWFVVLLMAAFPPATKKAESSWRFASR